MTVRLTRRHALGALGASAALAGTGLYAPARAASKVTVGALRFTSHAASFVAYERGYFKEAGLDVDFRFFQAAQPMAVAIASRDADFGVTAISGGLISLAEKGAAKVIGGALQEEQGVDGQMILASVAAYDQGVTAPARLGGRNFGITTAGSSFHYMGSKIAAAEGIDDLKFKPLQKVGAVIGALKSSQIDAWSIVPHIGKALVGGGAVKHIGMVADYIPDYQVTTVFTSAQNAANEKAKTEAFLAAFARGAADFNAALVDRTEGDDGAEAMTRLIHKYVYADQPYEKASRSIVNGAMRINAGAALNMDSIGDQLSWFKSEGLVKDEVSMEMLVDDSYVDTL